MFGVRAGGKTKDFDVGGPGPKISVYQYYTCTLYTTLPALEAEN